MEYGLTHPQPALYPLMKQCGIHSTQQRDLFGGSVLILPSNLTPVTSNLPVSWLVTKFHQGE